MVVACMLAAAAASAVPSLQLELDRETGAYYSLRMDGELWLTGAPISVRYRMACACPS